MARLARAEVFDPSEIAIVHAINGSFGGAFCSEMILFPA